MKKTPSTNSANKPRTIKISHEIHYKVRVLSAQKGVPLQAFVEDMLLARLRQIEKRKPITAEVEQAA